jgi:hypothetical protein
MLRSSMTVASTGPRCILVGDELLGHVEPSPKHLPRTRARLENAA